MTEREEMVRWLGRSLDAGDARLFAYVNRPRRGARFSEVVKTA